MRTGVGYTGGTAPNPTYKSVCNGDGHTEAIKIDYDYSIISYEELLEVFFKEHSATGNSKVQYKSGIWYQNEMQHKAALKKIKELEAGGRRKVATTVEPASKWYNAERYHQKYIAKQRRWTG